jgi:phage shock protein A
MSENPNQPRKFDAVMGGSSPLPIKGAVLGGVDGVKWRLLSTADAKCRIAALKDGLNKYGDEGLKVVIQALQTETGLVQWAAYDLLWERSNLTGKQKLLKFFPVISEAGADYIHEVLQPSIIAMQEELKQLRLTVSNACKTQELMWQHYKQAYSKDVKVQLDQQTTLLEKLKHNLLALESKISEAETKQDLFKAQLAAALASKEMKKAIWQVKACLQELGTLQGCKKSFSEKMQLLDSLILKIQEPQAQVRQVVVSAILAQKHIEYQYNHAQTAVNIWQQQGQMDLQKGESNLGREALLRRKKNADTASILKLILEQQTAQVETLQDNLSVLDRMLAHAKTEGYRLASQSLAGCASF